MRAVTAATLLSVLALAACNRPASTSDQPAAPAEPAAAPEPAAMSDADKKAALADLPAAYQSADLDDGQMKFAICKSCHTTAEGAPDMTGPNLHGVFGRKAGTKPGFAFSDAMKGYGQVWDADHLDKYLESPRAIVPGTKMTYAGQPDAKARADLIAYLKVATSSPPRKG
jgi:cytochrome c